MRSLFLTTIAALFFAGCYTQTTSSGGDYWGYTGRVKHEVTRQTQIQRDSSTNPPTTTITTTTTAKTEYQGDDEQYGLWAHNEPSLIEHYSTNTYDGSGTTVVNNYYIDNDYYSRPSWRHWWRPNYYYPSYWGYDPYWSGFSMSFGCGYPFVAYNYGYYDPYCGWNSSYYGGWYSHHPYWSSWDYPYDDHHHGYYGGYRHNLSSDDNRGGKRGRIPGADRLPGGTTNGGNRLPTTTSLSGGGATAQNNFRQANTNVNSGGVLRQADHVQLNTTGTTSDQVKITPTTKNTSNYTAPSNSVRSMQSSKSDQVVPSRSNSSSSDATRGSRQSVTTDRSSSSGSYNSSGRSSSVSTSAPASRPAQSSSGSSSSSRGSGGSSNNSSGSSGNKSSDKRGE